MEAIETFTDEATEIVAKVEYDPFERESPRDHDGNTWTLVGFPNTHRTFGDEQFDPSGQHWIDCPKCEGKEGIDDCGACGGHGEVEAENLLDMLKAEYSDAHLIVPVQCYDHSLVRYYAGNPTTEHWDTGTAGVAILSKDDLDKEFDGNESKARENLDGELETFTDWANGEIFAYVVEDAEGETLDSCCGFYGIEYVKSEAKEALNHAVEQAHKEVEQIRYWAERDVETVS